MSPIIEVWSCDWCNPDGCDGPSEHEDTARDEAWPKKGLPMLSDALEVFQACLVAGEWSGAPYMIENPVGALSSHHRKPDFLFDPCDFGGYLNPPGDAYRKRTCLWTGGGFAMPPRRPVEPTEGSLMHRLPPGPDRSNLRSATPAGFARAVFEANGGVGELSSESSAKGAYAYLLAVVTTARRNRRSAPLRRRTSALSGVGGSRGRAATAPSRTRASTRPARPSLARRAPQAGRGSRRAGRGSYALEGFQAARPRGLPGNQVCHGVRVDEGAPAVHDFECNAARARDEQLVVHVLDVVLDFDRVTAGEVNSCGHRATVPPEAA